MNFGVIAVTSIALSCNASDTTASERQRALCVPKTSSALIS